MKKKLILFLIMPLIVCGCQHRNSYRELVAIDSLLKQEMVDSAFIRLANINIDSNDTELKAYYFLLKTQTLYKRYQPITSDSAINISYNYYNQSGDKEKLARTLLYRGNVRIGMGKAMEAMQDYKMAEEIVANVNDEVLRHNVFFVLSHIYSTHSEYSLALEYLKRARRCAIKARRNDYLVYDYKLTSVVYYYLAQYDSSYFYINKSIDAIKLIPAKPAKNRAHIWTGLGVSCYMMNDYKKAKLALEKSISIIPLGSAYAALARIYLKERDTLKAVRTLEEGLKVSDAIDTEIDIRNLLSRIELNRGNYQRAAELSRRAYMMKDSLTKRQKEENVKAMQIDFERRIENAQATKARRWLWTGLAITILIGVVAVAVVLYRWDKTRRRLAEEQRQVEQLQAEEQQVNKELSKTKRTVERLKRARQEQDKAMSSRQREWEKHKRAIERGHRLFMELNNGGSIVKWSSDDFKDFRTYYDSVNRAFAETIAQNYEPLSPNLYMLAALGHAGKNDDDIMATMGLTLKALRTTRTRLSKKEKGV